MEPNTQELDRLQLKYRAAVEEWVSAIRHEEALASGNHTVTEIDQWEAAHFAEDDVRSRVKAAKSEYEDALRNDRDQERVSCQRAFLPLPRTGEV